MLEPILSLDTNFLVAVSQKLIYSEMSYPVKRYINFSLVKSASNPAVDLTTLSGLAENHGSLQISFNIGVGCSREWTHVTEQVQVGVYAHISTHVICRRRRGLAPPRGRPSDGILPAHGAGRPHMLDRKHGALRFP